MEMIIFTVKLLDYLLFLKKKRFMSAHCYSHEITVSLSKLASGYFEIIMTPFII